MVGRDLKHGNMKKEAFFHSGVHKLEIREGEARLEHGV